MSAATGLDALPLLVERLGGRDWSDVGQAYQALAAAGEAGRAAVRAGLSHPRPRVRAACADFYDYLGRDEDVPVLCELLHDPVPSVRRQAVHSLACQRCKPAPLGADLTETLIGLALHDPTPRVRREAVYGLGERPSDPRIIAALEQIAATDANAKVEREAHRSARVRLIAEPQSRPRKRGRQRRRHDRYSRRGTTPYHGDRPRPLRLISGDCAVGVVQ